MFDGPPQRQEQMAIAQKSPMANGTKRRINTVFNTTARTTALSRVEMRTMVPRMPQTHILTPCDPPTN